MADYTIIVTEEAAAAGYASAAGVSAAAAKESELAAASSAAAALVSETNAAESEEAAGVSETNAAESASSAQLAETGAVEAKDTAVTAAGTATTQAGIATTQAEIATTKASEAGASALAAAGSEENALQSAGAAGDSATAAAGSAAAALLSENAASGSAATATTKADEAATSASEAQASAEAFTTTNPIIEYKSRIDADGGSIRNLEQTNKLYVEALDILASAKVLIDGFAGFKLSSGKGSKVYDMSQNASDLSSASGSEFYVGGGIAGNEGYRIKCLIGETGTKSLTHTEFTRTSAQGWSFIIAVRPYYPRTTSRLYISASNYLLFSSAGISLVGDSGTVILTTTSTLSAGKVNIVGFHYENSLGRITLNGTPLTTTVTAGAITVNRLSTDQTNYNFAGDIHHYEVHDVMLNEFDRSSIYSYIRSLHPEINGQDIGNQHWATSNLDVSVDGAGNVIPEYRYTNDAGVNPAPEKVTNGSFATDTGWTKPTGVTISGGKAVFAGVANDSSLYQISSGIPTSKWMKAVYTIDSITEGGVRARVGSGESLVTRTTAGTYTEYIKTTSASAVLTLTAIGASTSAVIDNYSVKEVGSNELADVYTYIYLNTGGSVTAKTLAALRASAGWCYYNNDAANGVVYGKMYNLRAVLLLRYFPIPGWRVPDNNDFSQLITFLGGTSVAGGRMKQRGTTYWTTNVGASNSSGFTMLPGGRRSNTDGSFAVLNSQGQFWGAGGHLLVALGSDATVSLSDYSTYYDRFESVRLLRNEPTGEIEVSYKSGRFTDDITSTAKQLPISFGRTVRGIRITSEQALTSVEAKLYNSAGTALATLITGKSVSAGGTKFFPVAADHDALLQDGTVRVTAAGNSGSVYGMDIEVLACKTVLSE